MSLNMKKAESRAIIKENFLKGISACETRDYLVNLYGDKAVSQTTIYRWYQEFKIGRSSTKDGARSGRPANVNTLENIQEVHELLMEDRRLNVRNIAALTNISMGSTIRILNHQLNLKKINDCWVPRTLTNEQKAERLRCSQLCLDLIQQNPAEFMEHYITVERSWIYYKQADSNGVDISNEVQPAKKAKFDNPTKVTSATEATTSVLVTIFWDVSGVIFMDFMDSNQFMTAEYYSVLLKQLNLELINKRSHLISKKLYFHHYEPDRVRDREEAANCFPLFEYIELPQPPCSPDLSPSDYFLYADLRKWLKAHKFSSREDFIFSTRRYMEGLMGTFYVEGIKNLDKRFKKCIELQGDYLDK